MGSVLEYKCPCCGGGIHFDSAAQQMKCPFCETEFAAEALHQFNAAQEVRGPEETRWELSANAWEDSALTGYTCPSCAGALVGEKTTAATRCPYCGNPAVLPSQLSGMFRPDFVIPFKLDKQAAMQAFAEHLKGKRLLPKLFRSESTLEEITGVYVPFWLYDCETEASASYKATKTRSWSDRRYHYTRTDYFSLRRSGAAAFQGIPADGSKKMDDAYMDAIEPYDYREMRPFQMTYLSGFLADQYDLSAKENQARIDRRSAASMEAALRGTVHGYVSCNATQSGCWHKQIQARYALLPVWTLNARYKDQLYRFAMNGQTGKFIGQLPLDKGRAAAWFFGLFGGLSALAAIAAFLAGGVL